jgi:hypothetical protein
MILSFLHLPSIHCKKSKHRQLTKGEKSVKGNQDTMKSPLAFGLTDFPV